MTSKKEKEAQGQPKEPEDVFTPRGEFNPAMYAKRTTLEKDMSNKLRKGMHLLLFGESGCGKSWLYKNFFDTKNIYFKVVNLANASRNGTISEELFRVVYGEPEPTLSGYDEKKATEVGMPGVAKGVLDQTKKYAIGRDDPLRSAFKKFRSDAGDRAAFLVFDNLERVYESQTLMNELADIVTLADDSEFVSYKIKLLIVGVPSGVKQYFANTPSHRTVANRIAEIEEVSRLSNEEARDVVSKGFKDELKYKIDSEWQEQIYQHILWITDGIPQAVQEYCLDLALLAEEKKEVLWDMLVAADKSWVGGSLNAAQSVIIGLLNERETKVQRRNQVLYALGQMSFNEFKAVQIEEKVREIFYDGDKGETIGGVGNTLAEISNTTNPVLKKSVKGDVFMFVDPAYKMAIRGLLSLDKSRKVVKKT